MALGLVAVVAGLVGRCAEGWKAGWLVMTMSLFCLGFLPIYYAPRYIMPVVLPLSLVLSMELAMGLWGVGWRVVAAGVVLGSFGYTAGERAYEAWRKPGTMVYRNIAAEIRRHGLKGAIACNDRVRTYNLALLVGEKVVGFPADEELEVVERKLRESKVGMLIVWRGDSRQGDSGGTAKLAPELARRAAWRLVFTSHGAEVYEPAGEGGR